jgi:hypothetical protein
MLSSSAPRIVFGRKGLNWPLSTATTPSPRALHDFENLEALAASNSIIAIHDVVTDGMDARRATSKAETAFHSVGGQRVAGRG